MSTRENILGRLGRALDGTAAKADRRVAVAARVASPRSGPIPARAQLPAAQRRDLFRRMAEEAACSVTTVASSDDVPAAVADYLAQHNLPARLRLAPAMADLPWAKRPLLEISVGPSDGHDDVSVTPAMAGIAETGTLLLTSGAATPTTLNFLPENHIVVVPAAAIVGTMEEGWALLRRRFGAEKMPRTVNLVTGPSRSADIEQTLQMGAHGPRRLHIILVDDEAAPD